jgi:TolB-like protein
VLPFVNMSGDKEQEYFSDGLSEELLNDLARINELQVAARTSSFYFKGEHADLSTIARKLNVASILEGSVRRSGHTLRVTAQLNNAVTGYHLWSETYDRDLGDVLELQSQIANAVASALKVKLLGDLSTRIEVGGTQNPAAYDAFLRATKAIQSAQQTEDLQAAISAFTEAIRLDPGFAFAYSSRSITYITAACQCLPGASGKRPSSSATRDSFDHAQADAAAAISLAPDHAEGHLALAYLFELRSLNFARANEEYERALLLAPGNVRVLRHYSTFAVMMGHSDAGIAAGRHAVVIDPLNPGSRVNLFLSLWRARHFDEAMAAARDLDPGDMDLKLYEGLNYYRMGDFEKARASCELASVDNQLFCLAMTFDKLGRRAEAQAALAKLRARQGDDEAYRYGEILAQWGDTTGALNSLETALHLRDSALERLRVSLFLDPLRKQPRFQAIERALNFPD